MTKKSGVSLGPGTQTSPMAFGEVVSFAVLIGTMGTLLGGYTYGLGNHIEQLPMVFRLLDDTYVTRDFFVNASTGFGVRFYYSRLLALLASFWELDAVYFVLTWLSHTLVSLVTYLVARDLFRPCKLAPMVASTLVMGVQSINLGGATFLHISYLIPQFLALPLALLSLWAGISRRPLICVAMAAFSSMIHPLVGLETGAIGLATAGLSIMPALNSDDEQSRRKTLMQIGKVAAGVIVLGLFSWLVWVKPQDLHLDSTQFIKIVAYFRHPHHYVPSSFPVRDYAALLAFLLAASISWNWWHGNPSTDKALARRILIPVVVVLGLCVGGFLFVEVFPSRLWTTAQTFRLLFIVKWLGLMMFGQTIARMLRQNGHSNSSCVGWLLLIGSGSLQPFFMLFGHIVELLRKRLRLVLPRGGIHLGLGLALMMVTTWLAKSGSTRESFTLLLFTAISFWFLLLPRRWYRSFIPVLSLCIVVLTLAVNRHYQIPFLSRYLDSLQPTVELSDVRGPDVEIADYARENTPEDAVFLTPPSFGRFRLVAQRAIVVDFKAFPFQDWAMVEWEERLLDCYGKVDSTGSRARQEMDELYRNITKERIVSVAGKYGVSYAVLYKDTPSQFPVMFENDTYRIAMIRAAGE